MSNNNSPSNRMDRRTLLRRASVGTALVLGTSAAGVASASESDTVTFDADTSAVESLEEAFIEVEKTGDQGVVTHHYSYDLDALDAAELPGASLQLELPDDTRDGALETHSERPVDPGTLEDASVVVETVDREPKSPSSGELTTHSSHWDWIAWAETNSLVCGTLAESEVPYGVSDANNFTGADISADGLESDCPVYVPVSTEWHLDSTDIDLGMTELDAEAQFYNNDFPDLGSVDSDHIYEIESTGSHDIEVVNSGAWSSTLLEVESNTSVDPA